MSIRGMRYLLALLLSLAIVAVQAVAMPGSPALADDSFFAGAICHAAEAPEGDGAAAAHDCCLTCQPTLAAPAGARPVWRPFAVSLVAIDLPDTPGGAFLVTSHRPRGPPLLPA